MKWFKKNKIEYKCPKCKRSMSSSNLGNTQFPIVQWNEFLCGSPVKNVLCPYCFIEFLKNNVPCMEIKLNV